MAKKWLGLITTIPSGSATPVYYLDANKTSQDKF